MQDEKKKILKTLSKEDLVFIKEEAEKQFQAIDDADNTVISKSNNIINVLIIIVAACIVGLIEDYSLYIKHISLIVLLFCGGSIFFAYKAIMLKKYMLLGTKPENIINDNISINNSPHIKEKVLITIIGNLNDKIGKNETTQKDRVNNYSLCIYIILFGLCAVSLYSLIIALVGIQS